MNALMIVVNHRNHMHKHRELSNTFNSVPYDPVKEMNDLVVSENEFPPSPELVRVREQIKREKNRE